MPNIHLQAQLLRAPVEIPLGQWFLVYPNDFLELITDDRAQELLGPKPRRRHSNGSLPGTEAYALKALAAAKRPLHGAKWNKSGTLSHLKAKGYATNANGLWTITSAGREALNAQ